MVVAGPAMGLQVRRSRREALADTAQHAGQALGELDVARPTQRIDNRGQFGRRENEVHAVLIDIRPRVIGWI